MPITHQLPLSQMDTARIFNKYIYLLIFIVFLNCSKDDQIITGSSPQSFTIEISEVLTNSATLTWTESIDPDNDTVFYDVYLEGQKISDNITQLFFQLYTLEEGTKYTGKIVASDPEGNEIVRVYAFETPKNLQPTNFTVITTPKDPLYTRLEWTEAIDPEGNDITYNVYLNGELVGNNIEKSTFFFSNLRGLTSYTGYVEAIDENGNNTISNFAFTTEMKIYGSSITLENQDQVNAFGDSYYDRIEGNLIIGSTSTNLTDISDLSSLITLNSIDGNLYIKNTICKNLKGLDNITLLPPYSELIIDDNNELLSLEGLEGLTSIYYIYIASNKKLLNFKGLNNLKQVTKLFWFPFNESLNNIEDLNSLAAVKEMSISNNDALLNLKGLENLITIETLSINSNDNLESVEGLNNIENCNTLSIQNNSKLTNLKGFDNLKTVNSISITSNEKMTSLYGLESLTKVTNSITIQMNINLETLEGINNVVFEGGTSYGYGLGIYENGKITNLDALKNFQFIDQSGLFTIRSNPELIDFCGVSQLLKNINLSNANKNTIIRWNKFNPTYQEMLDGECSQ